MKPLDLDKLQQSITELHAALPHMLQYYEIQAVMTRAKYEQLIRAGFTEAQAIELCKDMK